MMTIVDLVILAQNTLVQHTGIPAKGELPEIHLTKAQFNEFKKLVVRRVGVPPPSERVISMSFNGFIVKIVPTYDTQEDFMNKKYAHNRYDEQAFRNQYEGNFNQYQGNFDDNRTQQQRNQERQQGAYAGGVGAGSSYAGATKNPFNHRTHYSEWLRYVQTGEK